MCTRKCLNLIKNKTSLEIEKGNKILTSEKNTYYIKLWISNYLFDPRFVGVG